MITGIDREVFPETNIDFHESRHMKQKIKLQKNFQTRLLDSKLYCEKWSQFPQPFMNSSFKGESKKSFPIIIDLCSLLWRN